MPETILDVRRHPGHEQIRGAVRYDPHALTRAGHPSLPLDREDPVAIHVDSDHDAEAIEAVLRRVGCRSIRVIRDSIEAWRDAGGETEGSTLEQPVPVD